MSQLKKVLFKLALVRNGANISAVLDLLKKHKMIEQDKSLKKGYEEMALINRSLAEMCLEADNETLRQYEEKLTECE